MRLTGYTSKERAYHAEVFESQISSIVHALCEANERRVSEPHKALYAKDLLLGCIMSENSIRTDIHKIGMDFFTRLGYRRYEIGQKYFNLISERSTLCSLMNLKEIVAKLAIRGILKVIRVETEILENKLREIGKHNSNIDVNQLSEPIFLARESSRPSIQRHINKILDENGTELAEMEELSSDNLINNRYYQTFVSFSHCWDWLFERDLVGSGGILINQELPEFVNFTLLGKVIGYACRYLFVDRYGYDTIMALDRLAVHARNYPDNIIPFASFEKDIFGSRPEQGKYLKASRFSKGEFSPIEIIKDKGIKVKQPLIIWQKRYRDLARERFERER